MCLENGENYLVFIELQLARQQPECVEYPMSTVLGAVRNRRARGQEAACSIPAVIKTFLLFLVSLEICPEDDFAPSKLEMARAPRSLIQFPLSAT